MLKGRKSESIQYACSIQFKGCLIYIWLRSHIIERYTTFWMLQCFSITQWELILWIPNFGEKTI